MCGSYILIFLNRLLPILIVVVIWIGGSHAYKTGAPESACNTMTPRHNVDPRPGPPPYSVATSEAEIAPGQSISVYITGSIPFTGFLMRVLQFDFFISGEFTVTPETQLACNNQAITHKSNTPKKNINITWTAPNDLKVKAPFQFLTTIVKDYKTFWTMVQGAEIWASVHPRYYGNPHFEIQSNYQGTSLTNSLSPHATGVLLEERKSETESQEETDDSNSDRPSAMFE